LKVVLGPRDPGDALDVELVQMVKIHIPLDEERHLLALQPGADLTGAFVMRFPAVSTMAQAG
jgi:hypothetical protein